MGMPSCDRSSRDGGGDVEGGGREGGDSDVNGTGSAIDSDSPTGMPTGLPSSGRSSSGGDGTGSDAGEDGDGGVGDGDGTGSATDGNADPMGIPTSMPSGDRSWRNDAAGEDGSRYHVGGDSSDDINSGEDGEGGDGNGDGDDTASVTDNNVNAFDSYNLEMHGNRKPDSKRCR